jgi:hypothetical protein
VLINPYNLSVILQQVSLQLPAGLSMITGLTVEEMHVYYTIAVVHAVASSRYIRLCVEIPLKAADRYFELYQVHSLLLFHKGIGKYIVVDETFTDLAVAENRQFFTVLTPYVLSKCTQGLYTVCTSDMVLRTAGGSNRLSALFLGKTEIVVTKCKRLILNETFEPVWIRSPDANYWIYSLSTPQRVTVQCQEIGSPPTSQANYQLKLEETGVLLNSSSCYIHAESFKLLPHSLGRTTVTLNKASILLPNIEKLLQISEESLLQANPPQPVDLHSLDAIVEPANSNSYAQGIDVTKLSNTLREISTYQRPIRWSWVIGIAIIPILGLIIIWFSWVKCAGKQYPCLWIRKPRRNQSNVTANEPTLKMCEIGLQARPKECAVLGH